MPATFVDTSLWLALVDPRDANHARADAWLRDFKGRLVTSTDVLDETLTLVAMRCGHAAAVLAGERLQDAREIDLIEVDAAIREAAWLLFQRRPDKMYSLTDCTSFAIMRRLDLEVAATFDDDFRREGYQVVP